MNPQRRLQSLASRIRWLLRSVRVVRRRGFSHPLTIRVSLIQQSLGRWTRRQGSYAPLLRNHEGTQPESQHQHPHQTGRQGPARKMIGKLGLAILQHRSRTGGNAGPVRGFRPLTWQLALEKSCQQPIGINERTVNTYWVRKSGGVVHRVRGHGGNFAPRVERRSARRCRARLNLIWIVSTETPRLSAIWTGV